jgi:hypothetical protein
MKTPLVIIALLFLGTSVFAQRTDYSVDNFDFRNAVKAVEPVVAAAKPVPGKSADGAAKKTRALKSNAVTVDAASLVVPTVMTSGLTVNGANAEYECTNYHRKL